MNGLILSAEESCQSGYRLFDCAVFHEPSMTRQRSAERNLP